MVDKNLNEKRRHTSPRLNRAFLKYFPMEKEEKKEWRTKEIVSLGEVILAHYGIGFLETLSFELEQLIDTALYFKKNRDRNVTGNWIRQLFEGKIYGYSLSDAFLGVCYEEGIHTQKEFIQSFDYLGICWKFIDYWSVNRNKRDLNTSDLGKIEKRQFTNWIKILEIPSPSQIPVDKQSENSQLFSCDDHFLQGLKNDKLTEGIVKLYGALFVKNDRVISIKDLLDDPKLSSVLEEIKKITGEKKTRKTLNRWLKSVCPDHKNKD